MFTSGYVNTETILYFFIDAFQFFFSHSQANFHNILNHFIVTFNFPHLNKGILIINYKTASILPRVADRILLSNEGVN